MLSLEEAISKLSEEELALLESDPELFSAFAANFQSDVPSLKTDLTPSTENLNVEDQGTVTKGSLIPLATGLGRMVEAGGAGIGDIVTGKGLPQAAETVKNVEEEKPVTTTSGKAGKLIGSFFTPTQIALQATGAKLAPAVVRGLGKGATKLGQLIARPTETAIPVAQKGATEVIGALTGAEPEALQTVAKVGRTAVKGAAQTGALAEDLAMSMNKLSTHIGDLEKAANATLNAEKAVSPKPLIEGLELAKKKLLEGPWTTARDTAQKVIETEQTRLTELGDILTEPQLAQEIKRLQRAVGSWTGDGGTAVDAAFKKASGMANEVLKAGNPAYSKSEAKLAEVINLRDDVAKAMGLTKEQGVWNFKDFTPARLKGLLSPETRPATVKLMKELAKIPGMKDFAKEMELTAAKEAIEAPAKGFHKLLGLGTRIPELGGIMAGLLPSVPRVAEKVAVRGAQVTPAVLNAIYQALRQ